MNEKTRRVSPLRPTIHPDKIDQTFDQTRMDGVRMLAPREEYGPDVECVVCNGRTVHAPAADGSKRIVGYDLHTQTNVSALAQEAFGPGERVVLKESEANRLKKLGFVCSPEDYTPPPARKEEEVRRFGPEPAR
jgi:hypothetical protein